jgi:putative hydrolase of the HAD superfamily
MELKAIIFDIGGIVLEEPGKKSREILCKKFEIDSDKFKEFAMKNLTDTYCGKSDYRKFFKKLIQQENLDTNYSTMAKEWLKSREKMSKMDKNVKKIILSLKKDYLVGSFTNSTLLNDKAKQRKESYNLFDFNLISHKLGFAKPELKSYKILIGALKKKKIKSEETIFIDDEEKNLVIPRKLKMKTILFKDAKQLKKELNRFGVKV